MGTERCTRWRAAVKLLVLGLLVSCSSIPGPAPLSRVLEQSDVDAYARHLQAAGGVPMQAHFAWKAEAEGGSLGDIARADEQLSPDTNPFQVDDRQAIQRGAVIYHAHCLRCHGEELDGRGPEMKQLLPTMDLRSSSRRFAVTHFSSTPAKWFRSVLRGKTSSYTDANGIPIAMPSFERAMAHEQIWLAITYLMSADSVFPPATD